MKRVILSLSIVFYTCMYLSNSEHSNCFTCNNSTNSLVLCEKKEFIVNYSYIMGIILYIIRLLVVYHLFNTL